MIASTLHYYQKVFAKLFSKSDPPEAFYLKYEAVIWTVKVPIYKGNRAYIND